MTSPYFHPPFSGARRASVLYIERSLRDVYPKTLEEWEEGFRCDRYVDQELELWVRVSRCLNDLTRNGMNPERRRDAFKVLGACLNSTPATVFNRVAVRGLDTAFIQTVANSFFQME
jgi:hypothetical protein